MYTSSGDACECVHFYVPLLSWLTGWLLVNLNTATYHIHILCKRFSKKDPRLCLIIVLSIYVDRVSGIFCVYSQYQPSLVHVCSCETNFSVFIFFFSSSLSFSRRLFFIFSSFTSLTCDAYSREATIDIILPENFDRVVLGEWCVCV